MPKERLDVLLFQNGICESREMAKRLIMAGKIKVENEIITKPGTKIDTTKSIYSMQKESPYVSRGGLKLEKALSDFEIDLNQKVAYDIGASTGGFTDCMLQHGAQKVYAFDVGYGQLDWKLRCDPRVEVHEKINFRYIEKEQIKNFIPPDFASVDVSFISLRLILPALLRLSCHDFDMVALIKPQFEAGREMVGKNGIIKDAQIHRKVLKDILEFSETAGLYFLNLTFSPVKGAKGNIEYLAHLSTQEKQKVISIDEVVNAAHTKMW